MVNATTPSPRSLQTPSQIRPGVGRRPVVVVETNVPTGRRRLDSSSPGQGRFFGVRDTALDPGPPRQTLQASVHSALAARAHEREERHREESLVSNLLNTESRTRLMVSRLHELINQLCDLRIRAVGLHDGLPSISSQSLLSNLSGLDDSLVLLDSAITDLENRVATTARTLETSSGRPISDWVSLTATPRPNQALGASPVRSLLAGARQSAANSHQTRTVDNSRNNDSLHQRLGQFNDSLASLNTRLDRVASNFRSMQNLSIPTNQDIMNNNYDAGPIETLYDASRGFRESSPSAEATSTIPRLTHSLELSPEELELQSRIARLTSHDSPSVFPWIAQTQEGLLTISRRELERQNRRNHTDEPEASNVAERMSELIQETSSTREHDRFQQEEHVKNNEPPSRRIPTAASSPNVTADKAISFPFPSPRLSSHAPLCKELERIFIDGVEYRNCLGLWLSHDWTHAPAHALPLADSASDILMKELNQ